MRQVVDDVLASARAVLFCGHIGSSIRSTVLAAAAPQERDPHRLHAGNQGHQHRRPTQAWHHTRRQHQHDHCQSEFAELPQHETDGRNAGIQAGEPTGHAPRQKAAGHHHRGHAIQRGPQHMGLARQQPRQPRQNDTDCGLRPNHPPRRNAGLCRPKHLGLFPAQGFDGRLAVEHIGPGVRSRHAGASPALPDIHGNLITPQQNRASIG